MNSKPIKIPGPDHPISLTPTKGRVTATVNGKRIADTREALTLKEAAHPPVQYIPRKDVDMTQLQRTGYETYCPYKGECAYYSIPVGGERSVNAVWSYEAPYAAVSAIREYLAFDPDRVDAIEIDSEESNKALVLEAFDTLFNKRDYEAAARFWSPDYLQHSAHIEPGRDGLFKLIKSLPAELHYEAGMIVAEGDIVMVHGRFSGHGRPKSWIAADIVRIADGVLVEHWDVLQDEVSRAESESGLPMFGRSFTA